MAPRQVGEVQCRTVCMRVLSCTDIQSRSVPCLVGEVQCVCALEYSPMPSGCSAVQYSAVQ